MQKYVNHLLEDIEDVILTRWRKYPPHFYLAGIPDPYLVKPENFVDKPIEEVSFETQMAEMEMYQQGEASKTMFDHFGFSFELFPPASILEKSQIEALTQAILRMWAAFNYTTTFPKNTPPEVLYDTLCQKMESPQMLFNNGIVGIEFCSYNPGNCPFGAYCDCEDEVA